MTMYEFINVFMDNAHTDRQMEKVHTMNTILNGNDLDGKIGKVFEMSLTNKMYVAGRNQNDRIATFIGNGKKVRKTIEIKTNGGRIDNIENADFVIYGMDICNSTTKGKRRTTEVVIMPSKQFIDILNECNAIKRVNKKGMLDGYAIQVSNKAFYETIRDYSVKYEYNKIYDLATWNN